mmetsp:Transcript_29681/g.60619  ORF Transcript_29681/g.60619 Transcript_29681/m.60619 type:complete len:96 (-) Transcript_29681:12-299(-)
MPKHRLVIPFEKSARWVHASYCVNDYFADRRLLLVRAPNVLVHLCTDEDSEGLCASMIAERAGTSSKEDIVAMGFGDAFFRGMRHGVFCLAEVAP